MRMSSTSPGSGRPAGGVELVRALESATSGIRDPAAKLRFIRGALARYQRLDRVVRAVPFSPLRRTLERWLGLEHVKHLLGTSSLGGVAPAPSRAWRIALRAGAVLAGTATLAAIVSGAHRLWRDAPRPVAAAAAPVPQPLERPAPTLPAVGLAPAAVWLVEKGPSWEQYSNGLRIETGFAVGGEPRRYRTFTPDGRLEETARSTPVGILFHTSESDLWPLEAAFNENLRDSSQRLLHYVARKHLYNYLIDRFGRVYRVVEEEAKANHAGHSVWAQGDRVYINLNHAFLGISFETRWEGGRALPITQAQFAAGRNLSDYLRQRWSIAPDMCVVHGLTSVNPRKHLIGHHLDWARGFPFEAFGLPDQYRRPPPSVTVFGFGYDDDFLKVLGEPWAGVREAERLLAEEAARQARTLEELRRERQGLYDRWFSEQAREEMASASSRADQLPPLNRSGG